MAVAFGSVTTNTTGSSASISVTTPSANVGDLLVIILSNDYYDLSGLSLTSITPTATATEMTAFDADGGTNNPHIKAWWAPVVTSGAVTVQANTGHSDEEKALAVYIITGADTSTPIDNVAVSTSLTSNTTVTAPSVSPNTSNALLICHAQTDGASGANTSTYSTPSGMSNLYSVTDGAFMRAVGASQVLSASGATGTRSFGGTKPTTWVAASVAIKGSSGGGGGGGNSGITAWITG